MILVGKADSGFKNFANSSLPVADDSLAVFLADMKALVGSGADVKKVAEKYKVSAEDLAVAVDALKAAGKAALVFGNRYDFKDQSAVYTAATDLAAAMKAALVSTKGNINSLAAAQLDMDNDLDLAGLDMVVLAAGDEQFTQQFMKKFEKAPFMVVLSSYVSPLTASADVILPVMNWLEQDGTFLNIDGRLLTASAALNAPEGVLSSVDAFGKLAEGLDAKLASKWKDALKTPSAVVID